MTDDALRVAFSERLGELRDVQARLQAAIESVGLPDVSVNSRVKMFNSVTMKLLRR